jgi:hypothetical protein
VCYPAVTCFPRTSNDFEIQPWFGLYETSVLSLAHIYIYKNTSIDRLGEQELLWWPDCFVFDTSNV